MMRETFWKRLEALEELRALRDGPVEIRHIAFIHPDGTEVEATIASGPGGFVCRRAIGEELEAFKSCASKCLAIRWRVLAILVFLDGEPSEATFC
jgi:hypothetical protein